MSHAKESDIKEGDIIKCKQPKGNKTTPYFNPEQFVVVKRRGTTIFAENERHSRKRNISHFKKVVRRNSEQSESELDVELQAPESDNLQHKKMARYQEIVITPIAKIDTRSKTCTVIRNCYSIRQ